MHSSVQRLEDASSLSRDVLSAAATRAVSRNLLSSLTVRSETPLSTGPNGENDGENYGWTILFAPKPLAAKTTVTVGQRRARTDPFELLPPPAPAAPGHSRCSTPPPSLGTLLVAVLGSTACVWLNRFNLVPMHALLTSAQFLHQMVVPPRPLVAAAAVAASRVGGVAAFNGGPESGASQAHWHVHLLPAYAAIAGETPLQRMITDGELKRLGVRHEFRAIPRPTRWAMPEEVEAYGDSVAEALIDAVRSVAGTRWLPAASVASFADAPSMKLPEGDEKNENAVEVFASSFNWHILPEGVLVVKRTKGEWPENGKCSINSLSLLGRIFCSTDEQKSAVEEAGVYEILRSVLAPAN